MIPEHVPDLFRVRKVHRILVNRSGEPETAVLFTCSTAGQVGDVLAAVRRAVTAWITDTPEGREAWEESCADFNVGDLGTHLASVRPYLEAQGLYDVDMDPDFAYGTGYGWTYDTILGDRL